MWVYGEEMSCQKLASTHDHSRYYSNNIVRRFRFTKYSQSTYHEELFQSSQYYRAVPYVCRAMPYHELSTPLGEANS
jgi:hypothetical protein